MSRLVATTAVYEERCRPSRTCWCIGVQFETILIFDVGLNTLQKIVCCNIAFKPRARCFRRGHSPKAARHDKRKATLVHAHPITLTELGRNKKPGNVTRRLSDCNMSRV